MSTSWPFATLFDEPKRSPGGQTRLLEERFAEKVYIDWATGCWLWSASTARGYGKIKYEGKNLLAHRVSYEWHIAPIPEGLTLDHLCRRRACVNPRHLEPVSHRENILRGEGHAAHNARKTYCLRGHTLSGENLYIAPNGQRVCRTCQSTANRRSYQRKIS